jgi:hypothetical protein
LSAPLSLAPIPVRLNGHANEGRLVLAGGQLVAVLVRLDGDVDAAELKGRWFLEAGFGPCAVADGPVFRGLDEARAWVEGRIRRT